MSILDSSVVFLLPPGPLLSSMEFYTEPDAGRSSGPFSVPRFHRVRERAVAFLALKGIWVSLGRRLTASLCAALHPSDDVWHLLLLGWNSYRRSRSGPLIAKVQHWIQCSALGFRSSKCWQKEALHVASNQGNCLVFHNPSCRW